MLRVLATLLFWLSFTRPSLSFGTGSNAGQAETSSIALLGNQHEGFDRFCVQTQLTSSSRFQLYTTNGVITVYCLWSEYQVNKMILHDFYASRVLTTEPTLLGARNKSISFLRRDSFVTMCLLTCSRGRPYPRFNYLVGNEVEEPANLNIGCNDLANMKCKRVCPSIDTQVENGVVTCTAGDFDGSVCTLQCDNGFTPRGKIEKRCSAVQDAWFPDTPYFCDATCPLSIFSVENGQVTCNDSTFVGSVCALKCNEGYQAVGATERHCDVERSAWMPAEQFQCGVILQPTICKPLPQVANGEVECTKNNSAFSKCTMTCENGFYPTEQVVHWCFPDDVGGGHSWYWLTEDRVPHVAVVEESMTCTEIITETRAPETQQGILENNHYNAQLKRFGYCRMPVEERTPCGNREIARHSCVHRGCCWNGEQVYPNRCFRSIRTPINPVLKQPRRRPGDRSRPQVPISPYEPHRLTQAILAAAAVHYVGVSRPDSLSFSRTPNMRSPTLTCGCKQQAGISERCSVIDGFRRNLNISNPKRKTSITKKICGGVSSNAARWPWQAVVYFHGQLCGGTLVAPQYVITAAHCLAPTSGAYDHIPGQKIVALGATNLSNNADPHLQIRNIQTIVRHPNFTDASGYASNDIAILKLDQPVNVDGYYVRPLCLPENRQPSTSDDCYVTGFGKDEFGSDTIILQAARVPIVPRNICQRYFPGYRLTHVNVCAGGTTPGDADTCKGDSGGPLTCRRRASRHSPCNWYLAGITSFGRIPCGQGSSGVYTNVFAFQTWIRHTVWILSHHF